jgi:hypothetical protein
MIVETEQDGTVHLEIGGYDWWWKPGQRRVADGDDGGVTLPGQVPLTIEAVTLYMLGWGDGRQGGVTLPAAKFR